ncbi:MAG: hypothetical protein Q8Q26_05130 [Pseudorhodobacter sp.]|nr:hypothetical protein [Pseudorhodobacter sp.]
MITKKTVIVVGAGASNDIGFPLGVDLQKRVSSLLTDHRVELYQYFASAVKHLFDDNADRAQAAMRRATELGGPLRMAASVDNFLDQHWDEPDFVNVAKLAIAYLRNV